MKKSELLNEIKKTIEFELSNTIGAPDINQISYKILETLEEVGMQPPNIELSQIFPKSGLEVNQIEKHYYAVWESEE